MADINEDKTVATSYPPNDLYKQWEEEADDQNIAISQFIIMMVERGRKNMTVGEMSSAPAQRLRRQQANLREDLKDERARVSKLERRLRHTAQGEIIEYLQKNPGATTPEIIQHVADTIPSRVASYLDILEGDAIMQGDTGYRLKNEDNNTLSTQPSIDESDS